MYTIMVLLFVIGVAGGFVALYQANSNDSKDNQTAQNSLEQTRLQVESPLDTQSTNERNSINPQQSATDLQPASGAEIYSNYEGTQSTGRPDTSQ